MKDKSDRPDRRAGPRKESRFGIGEWYGIPFSDLSPEARKNFAAIQLQSKSDRPPQPCPFLSHAATTVPCKKEGGVCSLRKYERMRGGVSVSSADSLLRTICPNRFEEDGEVYRWIGEVILGDEAAVPIGSVKFRDLGTFDNIVVVPGSDPLQWCAVEKQAVYFSGKAMKLDFEGILSHEGATLPWPAVARRPDYRSSGPKRLMPQLQMKVPWFRRWGKKMAVVVDEEFFKEVVGSVKVVDEVPDCEVAWFVITYDGSELKRANLYLTTLDEAVKSVTAGSGLSLGDFQQRIVAKLARLDSGPA
jgi:hypothetical protein